MGYIINKKIFEILAVMPFFWYNDVCGKLRFFPLRRLLRSNGEGALKVYGAGPFWAGMHIKEDRA